MLILDMKAGGRVIIGDDPETAILLTMVINQGRRRLGIDAPKEVKITRSEIAPPELVDAVVARYNKK